MPYREPARRQTRYLRLCLDVLTTPSRCTFPWELMDGGECTRTCPQCAREVHDIAAMDAPQAETFLAERMAEPPKLELRRRPDGRVIESECPRGLQERRARRFFFSVLVFAVALGGVAALLR